MSLMLELAGGRYGAAGIGAPVFVGRNDRLSLSRSVDSIDAGSLVVEIETARSQQQSRWRKLGAWAPADGPGADTLELVGADAFVRARWDIASATDFAFAVTGSASLILSASSVVTEATGSFDAVDLRQYRTAIAALSATALSGVSPSLTVRVETSDKANGPWSTVLTFAALTAAGDLLARASNLKRYARIAWILSGGGSATFSVVAESQFTLLTPDDRIRLGIRGGAIPDATTQQRDEACIAATGEACRYIYPRYIKPLIRWEDDLRKLVAAIADWILISNRGFAPNQAPDETGYRIVYEDAVTSLKAIAKREQMLDCQDSSEPDTSGRPNNVVVVSSGPALFNRRPWGCA